MGVEPNQLEMRMSIELVSQLQEEMIAVPDCYLGEVQLLVARLLADYRHKVLEDYKAVQAAKRCQ